MYLTMLNSLALVGVSFPGCAAQSDIICHSAVSGVTMKTQTVTAVGLGRVICISIQKIKTLQKISAYEKESNLSGWDRAETPTGLKRTDPEEKSDKRKLKIKMTNGWHEWSETLKQSVICIFSFSFCLVIVGFMWEFEMSVSSAQKPLKQQRDFGKWRRVFRSVVSK